MNVEAILSQMTLEEKAKLCTGGSFWHTKSNERLSIEAAMMCDGPHGLRKQDGEADHLGINVSIKAVCFPSAAGLAASFDRELLASLGDALGEECRQENVAMLLGPGMNIKRSPLCGRNFEYFSEDPYLTGQLAASYIRALQAKGVAACPKHFAANNQETRRMSVSANMDERTLHEIYLSGFEDMVKEAHPKSIMCSYNRINGTFSSENKYLLTDVLRKQWGFHGFVVTDWGAGKDRVKGIQAGLDLEMPGGDKEDQVRQIVSAVENGTLSEGDLDAVVTRMLRFASESAENRWPHGSIDFEKDRALAAELAAQCAVLLKNEGDVLPLAKDGKVAFIGEFAKAPRYQGSGSSHIHTDPMTGAVDAARGKPIVYARGYDSRTSAMDEAMLAEAVEAAKNAQTAVIFAGLPASYEAEGFDRITMDMPENQVKLIEAVAAVNPRTVVVLHNGAPVTMPWADKVPAILEMYLGGEGVGEAAVKLLYGERNPCGKLAETFPRKLADNPAHLNFPGTGNDVHYREGIYVGYRYYDKKESDVLFPFGHGLSYTQFRYSDLQLDKATMQDTDTLTVTCKIKNTGTRVGKEVVQLYVRPLHPKADRPIRELKGFQKVALAPGEEKEVSFTLSKKSFAYYESRLHDWYAETGAYAIEIGASSRDLRLEAAVEVHTDDQIPMVFDMASTVEDILSTPRGQEILGKMLAARPYASAGSSEENFDETMGEGGAEMAQKMMLEMSVGSMISLAGVTAAQAQELLDALNA